MMWFALAAAVVVVVVGLVVMSRRRGRNSGAGRARDVDAANPANTDAYAAHTLRRGDINGGVGGGLGF